MRVGQTLLAVCAVTAACGGPATSPASSPTTGSGSSTTFALTGQVSDANTGAPIGAATITVLDSINASRTTASDGSGVFRLADLTRSGFTIRVRHDGYDSVFRGVTFVADTSVDIRMRPAMRSLEGTWTGTLSFTAPNAARETVAIPQLTMTDMANVISSSFSTSAPYRGSFTGTLQDPASIGSSTAVAGTFTLLNDLSGRNPMTCRGTSNFTGTVDWTRMTTSVSRIATDCGTSFTDVTLSLTRQQ